MALGSILEAPGLDWKPQGSILEGLGTPKLGQDGPKAPKSHPKCYLKLRFFGVLI